MTSPSNSQKWERREIVDEMLMKVYLEVHHRNLILDQVPSFLRSSRPPYRTLSSGIHNLHFR